MNRIPEYELSAEQMHEVTLQTIQEHIPLTANGYLCDDAMLVNVLVKAASDNASIEAACEDLEAVADSNTVRDVLAP